MQKKVVLVVGEEGQRSGGVDGEAYRKQGTTLFSATDALGGGGAR